jgi:hypothetical protein
MRATGITIGYLILSCLLTACAREDEPEVDKECKIDISGMDFTFGIDYRDTEQYLIPGEESDLSEAYLEEIRSAIGTPDDNIEDLLKVCHWINQNFAAEIAGGAMMGKNTVDELWEIKTFYGCHSLALIISSVLREFGFPAIMIETADVQWGYNYHNGSTQNFAGHVMSEVYVGGKWILLDNNCTCVEDYNPLNPFISEMNRPSAGYFVFAKGVDIWDYSGKDENFTHENMIFFSDNIYCFEDLFYSVSYNWAPKE